MRGGRRCSFPYSPESQAPNTHFVLIRQLLCTRLHAVRSGCSMLWKNGRQSNRIFVLGRKHPCLPVLQLLFLLFLPSRRLDPSQLMEQETQTAAATCSSHQVYSIGPVACMTHMDGQFPPIAATCAEILVILLLQQPTAYIHVE